MTGRDGFTQYATQGLIDQAEALGVVVPEEVRQIVCGTPTSPGGMLWVQAHPEVAEEFTGCCPAEMHEGPEYCTCWTPVFAVDQQLPQIITAWGDADASGARCGDCAFRRDSPEMSAPHTRYALLRSAAEGRPFWCHDGMRRPVAYRHPDGREVPGDRDDWQPPVVDGIPYRADGRPGLLCAGWVAAACAVRDKGVVG